MGLMRMESGIGKMRMGYWLRLSETKPAIGLTLNRILVIRHDHTEKDGLVGGRHAVPLPNRIQNSS